MLRNLHVTIVPVMGLLGSYPIVDGIYFSVQLGMIPI